VNKETKNNYNVCRFDIFSFEKKLDQRCCSIRMVAMAIKFNSGGINATAIENKNIFIASQP
jgi:hypothetical protein